MAIRIECYALITPVDIAKRYFPEDYPNEWCWKDGAICRIMGAMNPWDAQSMVETCINLGLVRYKEHDGKKRIGDFYVASQLGLDDTDMQDKETDWLRVYQGVAWNPSCPLGIDLPDKFPCWRGGFYYESAEEWRTAKLALAAFNKALEKHFSECMNRETDLHPFDFPPFPDATPYDDFFVRLGHKSWCHERRLPYKYSRHSAFPKISENGQAP